LNVDAAAPKDGIPPDAEVGVEVAAVGELLPGVLGLDPGIGGRDSNNDAPKADEGLNALSPLNPVVCGLSVGDKEMDGGLEVVVAPVGWLFNDENTESEKPDPVVAVFCEFRNGTVPDELDRLGKPVLFSSAFPLLNQKDDATLPISPLSSPPAPKAPDPFMPPNDPVCCRRCSCCWVWAPLGPLKLLLVLLPPIANSNNVGALGTGGAGATGIPNGFLEPV